GHANIVALLQQDFRVDPCMSGHKALAAAAFHGHSAVCSLLLADHSIRQGAGLENNQALRFACEQGHNSIVTMLLEIDSVDPTCSDDYCFRVACEMGHVDVVSALLRDGRVDPTAHGNAGLRYACRYGYTHLIRVLLDDPGVVVDTDVLQHCSRLHESILAVLLQRGLQDGTLCFGHHAVQKALASMSHAAASALDAAALAAKRPNDAWHC
ncbi:hypothetical protein HDU91_002413, partial [Kappamyces sp. JEL0680]